MDISKIDQELLYMVRVANLSRIVNCIVWIKDFLVNKEKIVSKLDEGELVAIYPFIGAIGVTAPQDKVWGLVDDGCVEYISTVRTAKIQMNNVRKLIEVEKLHQANYFGQGVNIAVIDTGCSPHLDLTVGRNRIKKFVNILNTEEQHTYDDNGHGTFVTGVLAGSGLHSGGKYKGIAPMSEVVVIKALNKDGETQAFNILSAMQWVYEHHEEYNIGVVCMSFGSTPLNKNDPLITGAKVLWDAGIVVVCAGGNDGPQENTIKAPGACESVITVGSVQVVNGSWEIADFSSRGPIYDVTKPDIVAPGVDIHSISNRLNYYTKMSGTSVSTPMVAGVVALLLSRDKTLTPNKIKHIILNSTIVLPYAKNMCGEGVINAERAIEY
ncbi:MAG: S8 family peptidase [Clostridia bacterium]|nr:S8 family peptidase [Clostridia bacterium]